MQKDSSQIIWTPKIHPIGSPYLLLPRNACIDITAKNLKIEDVLSLLMHPSPEQFEKNCKTEIGKIHLNYIRLALGEFFRESIDRDYSGFKPERYFPKSLKNQIKAESVIASQTWKLIRLLTGKYEQTNPLPILFYNLAQEHNLFFFRFLDKSREMSYFPEKGANITRWQDLIQSQNKKMGEIANDFKNPFDPKISPYSHQFLEICNFEAVKSSEFNKDYDVLVKARKHLTTLLFHKHPEISRKNTNKKEWRGRRY